MREHLRLPEFFRAFSRALAKRGKRLDLVPQLRRPFEVLVLRRLDHLLLEFGDDVFLVTVQEAHEIVDVLAILLLADLRRTGGGALLDRIQQARAEESPAVVVLADLQVTGAELE